MAQGIKTQKGIRKEALKKQLELAGYTVFPAYGRTHVDMYALLVIACNRMKPEDPAKAFYSLLESQKHMAQGGKINPKQWTAFQQGGIVNEETNQAVSFPDNGSNEQDNGTPETH